MILPCQAFKQTSLTTPSKNVKENNFFCFKIKLIYSVSLSFLASENIKKQLDYLIITMFFTKLFSDIFKHQVNQLEFLTVWKALSLFVWEMQHKFLLWKELSETFLF